jgi:DNA-binding helix-hairpin-helix protein with protein kinase domain
VATFGNVKSEYDKQRRQMQLDDHLSQFSLREARIPKVNSSDLAQLASYGFTTAFGAKWRDVLQVHGIGPVKASNIAGVDLARGSEIPIPQRLYARRPAEYSESARRNHHQTAGPRRTNKEGD